LLRMPSDDRTRLTVSRPRGKDAIRASVMTHAVDIDQGFDFLGFRIRRHPYRGNQIPTPWAA